MRCGPSWGKKEKHCDREDPRDASRGDVWDWIVLESESKLAISLLIGPRSAAMAEAVFEDFAARTDGVPPVLITTDGLESYSQAIREAYGDLKRKDLPVHRTLVKRKEKNRVVEVTSQVAIGSAKKAKAALAGAKASTSYVERFNGTTRHFNARKARKSYCFSKDYQMHAWVGYLCLCVYNFCWIVRTLKERTPEGPLCYRQRTPAMAAGLASEVWTLERLLHYPILAKPPSKTPKLMEAG
jgi:IS1 family transposase